MSVGVYVCVCLCVVYKKDNKVIFAQLLNQGTCLVVSVKEDTCQMS